MAVRPEMRWPPALMWCSSAAGMAPSARWRMSSPGRAPRWAWCPRVRPTCWPATSPSGSMTRPEPPRIALSGKNCAVDVGRVFIDDRAEEQVFLVMAGVGFAAAIMAGASHELKSRLGPLAYFVSGMRALSAPRASITLVVDGRVDPPRRVRTVVVGNCGKLLAGLVLMPAARVDDGLLDVVAIGPKSIFGWLAVTTRVLGRRRRGHRIVQHWQGRTVIISAETPQQAQLDGDAVGEVRGLRMRVDPGALLVRV